MVLNIYFHGYRNNQVYKLRTEKLRECKTMEDMDNYQSLPSYNEMVYKFWTPLSRYE